MSFAASDSISSFPQRPSSSSFSPESAYAPAFKPRNKNNNQSQALNKPATGSLAVLASGVPVNASIANQEPPRIQILQRPAAHMPSSSAVSARPMISTEMNKGVTIANNNNVAGPYRRVCPSVTVQPQARQSSPDLIHFAPAAQFSLPNQVIPHSMAPHRISSSRQQCPNLIRAQFYQTLSQPLIGCPRMEPNFPMNNAQTGQNVQQNWVGNAVASSNSTSSFGGRWSAIASSSNGNNEIFSEGSRPGGSRKEKTPMCQIAELARFNKLCHQYRLLNETGPAHNKSFTVALTLKEGEEYCGEGASIKKAQQEAAKRALQETKLPKSNNKQWWRRESQVDQTSTPTVLLNSMAHEKGMVPIYKTLRSPPNRNFRGRTFVGHHLNRFAGEHVVSLRLCSFEFIGVGVTKQAARHNAASQALAVLHQQTTANSLMPSAPAPSPASAAECETCATRSGSEEAGQQFEEELEKQLKTKSPISLVHEMALQKKMDVSFQILSEAGPAHDRNYVVACVLRNVAETIRAEGQGGSKKHAKHSACKEMIDLLKQTGPLSMPGTVEPRRPRQPKETRRKTIVKDVKIDPDYGQQINPISRLIQIQQAKKEPEPTFNFISESGQARSKEFLMEVIIGDKSCRGTGPNKKLAKRAVAEVMLTMLGYAKPLPKPGKSVLKQSSVQTNSSDTELSAWEARQWNLESSPATIELERGDGEGSGWSGARRSSSVEPEEMGSEERVSPRNEIGKEEASKKCSPDTPRNKAKRKVSFKLDYNSRKENGGIECSTQGSAHPNHVSGVGFMPPVRKSRNPVPHNQQMAVLGQQLLEGLSSPVDPSSRPPRSNESGYEAGSEHDNGEWMTAKQRLQYLAGACGFRIEFTDFPKTVREDGSGEYLTLVSLGISPPHVCNGAGVTVEMAQNEAATAALRALAECKPMVPAPSQGPTEAAVQPAIDSLVPKRCLAGASFVPSNGVDNSLGVMDGAEEKSVREESGVNHSEGKKNELESTLPESDESSSTEPGAKFFSNCEEQREK